VFIHIEQVRAAITRHATRITHLFIAADRDHMKAELTSALTDLNVNFV
jgi:hypothetical protein